MWQENQSEVVRLQKVLSANGLTGEELLQKFKTASREEVRLAAALRGFYTPGCGDEAQKDIYLGYLQKRVKNTVNALMEENRVPELEDFLGRVRFSTGIVDEFLQTAMELNRPEILVWLLKEKQHMGFRDRDFSL